MGITAKKTESEAESEESIALDIAALLKQQEPNVDAILRKTGRFNRLRGRRVKRAVLAAIEKKGDKDVDALLDRNR